MKNTLLALTVAFSGLSAFSAFAANPVAFYNNSSSSITVYDDGSANDVSICGGTGISGWNLDGEPMVGKPYSGMVVARTFPEIVVRARAVDPSASEIEVQFSADSAPELFVRGTRSTHFIVCE